MRIALAGWRRLRHKHLDGLAVIDGVTVTSVVSRRLEQAKEVARKYGVGHASTDLDEVLARDDVDAVILATPTQLHARQAIVAMRAGKHVQVEIPLADSWADAQEVDRTAHATGLVCMVGHTRRFNPSHQWIRRRIAAGELSIQQMDVQTYFFRRKNLNALGEPFEAGPITCSGITPRTPSTCSSTRPARTSRSPMPCRGRSTLSSASRWTCPSSCAPPGAASARSR
jgi:2-hydroxy-4-carboxymuconate semialdehyde hemiacetal dehydrogenase